MKCPNCRFVCSDLRDLCPQCTFDLRPQKQAIGVKISNPKASYEELLKGQAKRKKKKVKSNKIAAQAEEQVAAASVVKTSKEPKEEPKQELPVSAEVQEKKVAPEVVQPVEKNKKSRPGFFARLFSKQKPATAASTEITPAPTIDPLPQPLIGAAPTSELPEQPKPAILDLSNDDNMLQTLQGMYGDTEIEIESIAAEKSTEDTEEIDFEIEFEQAAEGQQATSETTPTEPQKELHEIEVELAVDTTPAIEETAPIVEFKTEPIVEEIQTETVITTASQDPGPTVEPEQQLIQQPVAEEIAPEVMMAAAAQESNVEAAPLAAVEPEPPTKKPGLFARLFGKKNETTPASAPLAPEVVKIESAAETYEVPPIPEAAPTQSSAESQIEIEDETPAFEPIVEIEEVPQLQEAVPEQPVAELQIETPQPVSTDFVLIDTEIPTIETPKHVSETQLLLTHTPNAAPPPAIYTEHLPLMQPGAGVEASISTEEPTFAPLEEPNFVAAADSNESEEVPAVDSFDSPEFEPGIIDETLIDQLEDIFPEVPITPETADPEGVLTVHADAEETPENFVEDIPVPQEPEPVKPSAISASALEEALAMEEALARELASSPPTVAAKAPPQEVQEISFDDATVNSLFQMMLLELDSHAVDVELQFENLAPFEISDEILVLFDLATEVIQDPNAENRYVNSVSTGLEGHVEAHDLEVALDKTEAEMNPEFSLATGFSKKKSEAIDMSPEMSEEEWHKQLEEELGSRLKEITIPSVWRRLSAFAIDQSIVAILAVLLSFAIATQSPHRAGAMLMLLGDTPNFTDALVIYGLMCSFFILLTPLVPILSTFLFKKSVGFISTGLTLYKDNGTRAEWTHLCLRSALFPLSVLCFGYIPILKGGQALHDTLSKTVVGRRRGLAQARKVKRIR